MNRTAVSKPELKHENWTRTREFDISSRGRIDHGVQEAVGGIFNDI